MKTCHYKMLSCASCASYAIKQWDGFPQITLVVSTPSSPPLLNVIRIESDFGSFGMS